MKTSETYHLADPVAETRPTCGAILVKFHSPLPTLDRARVNCPVCLSIMSRSAGGGAPTPLHTPPYMADNDDGLFIFYDTHETDNWTMEVVPQTTGNVEITIGESLFTLSHLDRADLLRALLHDFHYSPERGGPNDDD